MVIMDVASRFTPRNGMIPRTPSATEAIDTAISGAQRGCGMNSIATHNITAENTVIAKNSWRNFHPTNGYIEILYRLWPHDFELISEIPQRSVGAETVLWIVVAEPSEVISNQVYEGWISVTANLIQVAQR